MNYLAIQDEVIELRFDSTTRDYVKNWIDARYAAIWGDNDWHFKKVLAESLSITASDNTPTMPTTFGRVLHLYDNNGVEVEYLSPASFDYRYATDTSESRPMHYTVVNRQIYLGPIPVSNQTFKLSYERQVCHYADATTLTAGVMNSDLDTPVWPSEHHYVLVVGALATGLKLKNDRTWEMAEQEFRLLYDAMAQDLLPPDQPENLQYGRQDF